MLQYTDLELNVLMDLLVKHTNEYTHMLTYSSYTVEEFAQCRRTLGEIQQAIKLKIEEEGYLTNQMQPNTSENVEGPQNNSIDTKEQPTLR